AGSPHPIKTAAASDGDRGLERVSARNGAEAEMIEDDDDDGRAYERLRKLGLLDLRDKPNELTKALDRILAERKAFEEQQEIERLKIRARVDRERAQNAPTTSDRPSSEPSKAKTPNKGAPKKKPSTLVIATKTPGSCAT